MSDRPRYGYYLRPSPTLCAAQAQVHELLKRQYGLQVAGVFMPHCTVKGFFKSSAPEEEIRARAATITQDVTAFPVWNSGVVAYRNFGIVLSIMRDPQGNPNQALRSLHDRAMDVLEPLIDDDCEFTPGEWNRERFDAHLTLAMADVEPRFYDEIVSFCQQLEPIGPAQFTAERLHLFSFQSADWRGAWWDDLTWSLVESWHLPQAT